MLEGSGTSAVVCSLRGFANSSFLIMHYVFSVISGSLYMNFSDIVIWYLLLNFNPSQ